LVPYKKIDLIVSAFSRRPDLRLIVIGDGPEMGKIKRLASANIEIVGHQTFSQLKIYLQTAKAFIFAAQEDFGIVPVEAQACGTPVICLGSGGTAETVKPLGKSEDPTGVWFYEQSSSAIFDAIKEFEASYELFKSYNCRKNAEYFSSSRFRREISGLIENGINQGFNDETTYIK
jgi:glycosyltransferase involved in cell wall biosynthesis